ncbi:hypothetical protein BFJ63_vAg9362 [Fusarium oxysporum f. sp. narcissi]|uniref:Uncharacterized protein n=1 Tax=Fusarium oxysporum f. sp. narcissi TaxID=451672 RepID=A0A4Q2VN87_FUSOX|nr:hypothetical protein BFJ71_g2359 [Fusarium oxysporum]RYC87798.1 hypothetical protein BFJ63_vAg9362 [Fusarium oxysporum f. sp. narcissi]
MASLGCMLSFFTSDKGTLSDSSPAYQPSFCTIPVGLTCSSVLGPSDSPAAV